MYHIWYNVHINMADRKPIRWTRSADPALIEPFRPLASEQKRPLKSALMWALEQYAKAAQRNTKRAQDA